MFEHRRHQIHRRLGGALRRITEELAGNSLDRPTVEGGDPAIRDPGVVEVLVTGPQRRVRPNPDGHGRIDPVALDPYPIAVGIGVLVNPRGPDGHRLVQAPAHIGRQPPVVPRAVLQRHLGRRSPGGLTCDAVDDPADTSASEDHRVRSLQSFDAIHVVDIPEVLNVVADPVHEEVRCRTVAAEDGRVAVPLSLRDPDTRHVAGHVGHARHP